MDKEKKFRLLSKIGFFAFILYYLDETVVYIKNYSESNVQSFLFSFGLLVWFLLILIPLAYFGFRKTFGQ